MARKSRERRICEQPKCSHFVPAEQVAAYQQAVILNLDEFECIRLMDYEGLTQEQCAEHMQVARTTVQAIYKSAREKMATSLVQARALSIAGGCVYCCSLREQCTRRYCCDDADTFVHKGGNIMRVAVTYDNGQIFQHFGHTEQFKLYDVAEGAVTSSVVVDTNGSGHGALAGFLKQNGVDVLICGGIGGGAQNALASAGIQLFGGVSGSADAAVDALVKNVLVYNPNVKCNHHGEGHAHGNCGSHGCGSHTCGSQENE